MKTKILLFLIVIYSNAIHSQSVKDTTKDFTQVKNGNYIPFNLYDCFYTLDIIFDSSDKQNLLLSNEKEFTDNAHYEFGGWMYKNWQFKKNSRIKKYFRTIGVYNINAMLEIILNSYYKYYTDSSKNKEKLVHYFETYWKDASLKKTQRLSY